MCLTIALGTEYRNGRGSRWSRSRWGKCEFVLLLRPNKQRRVGERSEKMWSVRFRPEISVAPPLFSSRAATSPSKQCKTGQDLYFSHHHCVTIAADLRTFSSIAVLLHPPNHHLHPPRLLPAVQASLHLSLFADLVMVFNLIAMVRDTRGSWENALR